MTLVLEESEDIPIELLSPILASIKKDNQVNFHLSIYLLCLIFQLL